jgi:hypothetical protein
MMTLEEANSALKLFGCHITRHDSRYQANSYIYYLFLEHHAEEVGYWTASDDVAEVYNYVVDNYL